MYILYINRLFNQIFNIYATTSIDLGLFNKIFNVYATAHFGILITDL